MVHAILLGAGKSVRLGFDVPKQFVKIAGKTILEHVLETFEICDVVDSIVLVVSEAIKEKVEEILVKGDYKKVRKVVLGGETRRESSFIGVSSLDAERDDIVLIHDVARPFVDCEILKRNVDAARIHGAVDTVIDTSDTIVVVDENGFLKEIPVRRYLRRGQTPQTFKYWIIKKAHELALKDPKVDEEITDDCGLILRYKLGKVYTVKGSDYNIKITYPVDVYIADKIFQLRKVKVIPRREDLESLKDRVLVVFGGTSGIGEKVVEYAEMFGMRVRVFSRRLGIDVSDFESVESAISRVFEEEGRVDFVVNTAGILRMGKLLTRDLDDIEYEIRTNYIGSINVAKASMGYLRRSKGMLVFFSSSSYTRGRKLYSIYSSTKAAIVNLTQSLSEEEPDVRFNVVVPERTATPLRFRNFGKEPSENLLKPETVAVVTLELLTKDITGAIVEVRKIDEDVIWKEF